MDHSPSRFDSLSSSSKNSNLSKAELCSIFSNNNSPLNNVNMRKNTNFTSKVNST